MNPEPLEPGAEPREVRGSIHILLNHNALQLGRNLRNLRTAPSPIYGQRISRVRVGGEIRFLRFRPLLQVLLSQIVTSRNLSPYEVPVRFLRFRGRSMDGPSGADSQVSMGRSHDENNYPVCAC
jgi:hypothetical protein